MDCAVVSQIVGVALGFLSAISVEWIAKTVFSNQVANKNLALLIQELRDVVQAISQMSNDEIHAHPYEIPAWRSMVYSGQLSGMAQKKYFGEIVSLYVQLEQLNEWEAHSLAANIDSPKSRSSRVLVEQVQLGRQMTRKNIARFLKGFDDGRRN